MTQWRNLQAFGLHVEVEVLGVEGEDVAVLVGHGGLTDWHAVLGVLPLNDWLWDEVRFSHGTAE